MQHEDLNRAIKQLAAQGILWDHEGCTASTSCCYLRQTLKQGRLFGRYDIFGAETLTAEDPAPELVLNLGDCFIFSTTTIHSPQEAKNSATSCLTESLAHIYNNTQACAECRILQAIWKEVLKDKL